jgi:hypothetical protein
MAQKTEVGVAIYHSPGATAHSVESPPPLLGRAVKMGRASAVFPVQLKMAPKLAAVISNHCISTSYGCNSHDLSGFLGQIVEIFDNYLILVDKYLIPPCYDVPS